MRNTLYLAWRYVLFHRYKTSLLVASITLIVYLPVGLEVLVTQSAAQLTSRAEGTPLLVGAKGSPLELVLNSLYFESDSPQRIEYRELTRVVESGLARTVPLHVRFESREHPIVGTTLDYFDFRDLRLAAGRPMALLGECVVGAQAARALGVGPDDSVISSPENAFDLAGIYPLKMRVAGVFAATNTPDDHAIFVDLKTAWTIAGLGHGHRDLAAPDAGAAVLSRDGNTITANASVVQYNEIDASNAGTFHFHGDPSTYPITAIVVIPHDEKSGTILRGRYGSTEDACQIVRPTTVMEELLATVLTVETYVVAGLLVVGLSTLATTALVFLLSLRLRRREIATLVKIGGSRQSIAAVLASEVVVVLLLSVLLGGALTFLTSWFGSEAIRLFILG